MEYINFSDPYVSHEHALTWQYDLAPAARYLERIQDLHAELDGRSANTPQAKWARALLATEVKLAKKHLAAMTAAAAKVEPVRDAFRAALEAVKKCEAAVEAAYNVDASALQLARFELEIARRKLVAARQAFADATVACATSHRSECTLQGVLDVRRANLESGTPFLVKHAHLLPLYEAGYYNKPHDSAQRQGREFGIEEMIANVSFETDHLSDPDCAAAFALRWTWFCKKNGIAFEPAQATAAE